MTASRAWGSAGGFMVDSFLTLHQVVLGASLTSTTLQLLFRQLCDINKSDHWTNGCLPHHQKVSFPQISNKSLATWNSSLTALYYTSGQTERFSPPVVPQYISKLCVSLLSPQGSPNSSFAVLVCWLRCVGGCDRAKRGHCIEKQYF